MTQKNLLNMSFGRVVKMPFSLPIQNLRPLAPNLHNIVLMMSYKAKLV